MTTLLVFPVVQRKSTHPVAVATTGATIHPLTPLLVMAMMILVIPQATTRRRLVGQLVATVAVASKLTLTNGKLPTGTAIIPAALTRVVAKLAVPNPAIPSSHHLVAKLMVIPVVGNQARPLIPEVPMQG